ncbi:MAG: DegT/DnrJ/EryC1/StrS family aminotransferase [Oligoflexia bacterium]|nr:DegT/DnrJ/EryC1/StrS family aminotransferase [Oligoflexia bacterium]
MSNTKLAILGGTPVNNKPVPPYNTIGADEKSAVLEVLDSGELSGFVAGPYDSFWGGKKVRELEEEFKKEYNVKYAIAVNSATSGLHCALHAMNIGSGDEVITTPITMSATASTILMTGAVPIFADIDEDTFCIDPESIEKNITPNTKGIAAVNIFGHPANLKRINEIAKKHNLFVLEDNAQAPHAKHYGKYTGTIGDAGVFSFNRHKTMQCGEGGVIITDNEEIAFKAACMRNHGEIAVEEMGKKDIVNTIGVNYRMTEMEAAVALVQFKKIKQLNKTRIDRANRITDGIKNIDGITAPYVDKDSTHSYYFYVMKYDEAKIGIPRDLFVEAVMKEGYYLRGGYVTPLYQHALYQQKICFGDKGFPFTANPRNNEISYEKGLCPVAERLHEKEFILTNIIYEPYTLEDMDNFIESIKKVIANKDELLSSKM